MNEKRIRNVVLAIVAGLLLLNLGCMLSPGAHAVSKIQYKTVRIAYADSTNSLELGLNAQGADGWEYVGEYREQLIFKK